MSNSNSNNTMNNAANGNFSIGNGNNTSGTITWPSTNTNTIWTQPGITISPITFPGGFNYSGLNAEAYLVFKLPYPKIPEAVYVSGRMLSMGILGSDAECAYIGNAIIFGSGLTNMRFNDKITLILQYADVMIHYNIHHNFGIIEFEENSKIIKTTLLSQIKRGEKCLEEEI